MKKNRKSKLHSRRGFTLVEMLCVTLIMVLMCLVLASGLSIATNAFHSLSFEAEAQILMDNVNTAISDYVRFAVSPSDDATGRMTTFANRNTGYNVSETGYIAGGSNDDGEGRIYLHRSSSDTEGTLLVNEGAYDEMTITDFRMRYDSSTQVFSGSYTINSADMSESKDCTFSFRTIAV